MRLFMYLSLVLIGIVVLALLGFYYQLAFPQKILAFQTDQVKLDQTVYHPGDAVMFTVPYCKYQDNLGQHTITLEDGTILPVYSDIRSLPLGCHTVTYPIVLVAVTPPGKYRLVLRVDYQVQYLFFAGTRQSYSISSNTFTVEK